MNSIQYEQSLNGTIPPSFDPTPASIPSASIPSASAFSSITSQPWHTWIIVILALAFLGINVFSLLGKGTQEIMKPIEGLLRPLLDIFKKLLKLLGFSTLETVKQTANVSATGVNTLASSVAATTEMTANSIEQTAAAAAAPIGATPIGNTSTTGSKQSVQGQTQQTGSQIDYGNNQIADVRANTLQIALNDAEAHMNENNQQNTQDGIEPDDSYSAIQSGGKAGWCYIGEERGIRSCMKVGINDQCMSDDIFPTNDVCVNPKLRVG